MTKQVWQALHKAAMLETDPLELRKKTDLAHAAIHERIDELANNHDSTSVEERQETMDALNDFQILQRQNSQTPAAVASAQIMHEEAAI
jgi:hypothetical protein